MNLKTSRIPRLHGMRGYILLWAGQFVSIFATRMSHFAITLWAWDLTGTATGLVLVGVLGFLPSVVLSPFAGSLVDRLNRKLMLAVSDAGAALGTAILLVLFYTGKAQIWHLYVVAALMGAFGTFQYPAYSAVVTTMVPKEQYARANGMMTVVSSASGIAAPLLAGALLLVIDIPAFLVIDLVTFGLAMVTLVLIVIPQPESSQGANGDQSSIWKDTWQGFLYVFERKSLFWIILLFTVSNIAAAFLYPMMAPMILARTGDDSVILGTVQSASSLGFLVGGLLISAWGGPKRRIHAVNISFIVEGILGALVFGLSGSLPFWIIGGFFSSVGNPIINSAYIAIIQAKVAPEYQGRVFGIDHTVSTVSYPLGQLIAGQLADRVLEPAFLGGGMGLLGSLLGKEHGTGMGLVISIGGIISVLVGIAGYLIKPIRNIEDILPDHKQDESGIHEQAAS
jgi:DHA3 family macrolide efflux protein-like MFS transporter